MRIPLPSDFPALLAVISSLASWQDQLDWGLRIAAALIAIVAGTPAAWRVCRKVWGSLAKRRESVKE